MHNIKRRTLISTLPAIAICGCGSMPSGFTNFAGEVMGINSASLNQQVKQSYDQLIQEAKQNGKLDRSSTTAKRVHAVFRHLLPFAQAANQTGVEFEWQIEVIRSDELNAWAMPGGKMAFYSGIVEKLKLSNAEIATIMGHEMAHAFKEHGKSRVIQQQSTNIALGVLANSISITSNAKLDNLILNVSKTYGLDLPFNRSSEAEADKEGLLVMAQAGYNPRASIKLWEKMSAKSKSSDSNLANFMSTHPTHGRRIAELTRLMPTAVGYYDKSKVKRS